MVKMRRPTKTTNSKYLGKAFMPRDKTAEQQTRVLVEKLKRMMPGQSFFVPDVTRADMEFLRRPVVKAGVGIRIAQVEEDEIYFQPGVRVWREEGEYDEL
jgi:hypothetical protein